MSNISEFVDKKKTDLILEDICLFLRIKEFFELFFLQHCEMYHFSTTWLISPKKLIGCSWTIYNRWILGPARPPLNYLSRPDSESVSPGGIRLGWGLRCQIVLCYHIITVCRVYLAGQSKLHDGSVKSVRRASNLSVNRAGTTTGGATAAAGGRKVSNTQADSSDEQIHPGPIFLSHVVSRKFPYRWLVLGISAFSCMAIIVVVSVVYSNRWCDLHLHAWPWPWRNCYEAVVTCAKLQRGGEDRGSTAKNLSKNKWGTI